ncbi:two-component system, OmpR family, alkaline phosphatase synthesis response regulator PhoP [Desulfotomaculum arcticum]|uniref:Stage 0 sporulation protein A homolog n=1 Tax=Desulfotruncus arcticus DSM 17038 TaxID=1121424 RepID=A0A1I2WST3_9FIRM|nr:response regulator transcription factor [Desulfotruncus arcticus]SFH03416.1 two-component system, OmpR family, alkaline phosphatase synthesis response regulator PhoP [Desulfotomaculum arcticum] [Desulfotruncus arcticus DSM 17038]
MSKKNIMLVDDDMSILKLLRAALEKNGYHAIPCASGEEALENLDKQHVDAVILDVVLPSMDGLEVLRRIRNSPHRQLPVIMLTCKNSEIETVVGLEMGADDYLSKPVRYHELIARLKTIFRRTDTAVQPESQTLIMYGMEINLNNRTIHFNNEPVLLTHMEFELLTLLAKSPGRVFSRENLLDILWHEEQYVETRTVDVHIRRLRKKMEEHGLNPNIIETVRSIGYRLCN